MQNHSCNSDSEIQINATESNELLNGNEMKVRYQTNGSDSYLFEMTKFDRTDSEDDILEDYSDDCNCSSRLHCIKSRTALEKCLFVFSLIGLIIIIVLAACLGSKTPPPGMSICETQDCIEVSSSVLTSMDRSADPCQDFYQYSCGGWEKNNPAPPGYLMWDRFQQLSYTNLYRIKAILDDRTMTTSSEKKTKQFYDSCMAESKLNRLRTLSDFRSLVKNITDAANGTLGVLLESVHGLNAWPLFSVLVGTDDLNPDKNVVKIDIGDHKYPLRVKEVPIPSTTPAPNINSSVAPPSNHAGYAVINDPPTQSKTQYLQWNSTEVEKNYLQETIRILKVIWNMSDADASTMAKELLEIEKAITKTYENNNNNDNQTTPVPMKIVDLETSCSMIEWPMYLTVLTKNTGEVSSTDNVVLLERGSLLRTCALVDTYKKDANKFKLLQRYIMVHLISHLMPYFEADTFEPDLDYAVELEIDGEHWRRCVHYTNKALGFVTGSLYVNGMGKHTSVNKIKQIVQDVKLAFKDYLLRKIWLDPSTKKEASQKLDEMLEKISYPEYILKSEFLDKYYTQLNIGNDWFVNVQRWQEFQVKKMMSLLSKVPDRSSWINPPITVESDYSPVRNDVIFPIALFHLPFYTEAGPPAFNFGAIGSVIGHEITHAFDIKGRRYDGKGRLREWWDPMTADRFKLTTKCMKSQYDAYTYQGFQINGNNTLDENIADNGGLRAAFIAYQLWERQHGKDHHVPGLNMTNRQLFFVSYAQMFCSKWKKDGLIGHLIDDPHSPGPIRVRGSVSNTEAFAEEFNCPFVANYNPTTKCEVW
ncbi:endothelin-converting enzyme 1-like isoform X2 [Mizuhopecten yessoensis]|uniref:endothelin-converting enzyme 1-like isoform X2 n=1 Tax=Mizuhopecten yessoensis TaxID=6573 RepID=UPI000B45CD05|nr:endothelin-converting enzyme 1-like isoform X2 [Mizuhopecten yessoensis]